MKFQQKEQLIVKSVLDTDTALVLSISDDRFNVTTPLQCQVLNIMLVSVLSVN